MPVSSGVDADVMMTILSINILYAFLTFGVAAIGVPQVWLNAILMPVWRAECQCESYFSPLQRHSRTLFINYLDASDRTDLPVYVTAILV